MEHELLKLEADERSFPIKANGQTPSGWAVLNIVTGKIVATISEDGVRTPTTNN